MSSIATQLDFESWLGGAFHNMWPSGPLRTSALLLFFVSVKKINQKSKPEAVMSKERKTRVKKTKEQKKKRA